VARYLGPKAKLSRREGTDLFLKSARRSISDKAKFDSKPGQHGRTSGQRTSDFGLQLREKQKVRRTYGVLERQFRNYFDVAEARPGVTGEALLRTLELRLDNVVYRLGLASSRAQARQLVGHGHFAVNGVPTNIPSFQVKPGDTIEVRESRRAREPFKLAKETLRSHQAPEWLSLDAAKLAGTVADLPRRDQMPLDLNEQLVVEYYSR
jgi:small subunit ribosomal protein S4